MQSNDIVFIPFHTGDTTSLLPTFEGLEQADIPFQIIPVGQSAHHRLPERFKPFVTLPPLIEKGLGRNEQSAEAFPDACLQEIITLINGAKNVVIGFPSMLQEQIANALPENTNKIIYFDCLTFNKEKATRFIPLADAIIVMTDGLKQQFETFINEIAPSKKPKVMSAMHGDFTAWKKRFLSQNPIESAATTRQQLCISTNDKLILWAGGYGHIEQTSFKTFIHAFKAFEEAFSLRITLHPGIKNASSQEEKIAQINKYYKIPLVEAGFDNKTIENLISDLETFDVAREALAVISAGSTVSAQAISIGTRAKNVDVAITGVEKVQSVERWHELFSRWQQKERRTLDSDSFKNAQKKIGLPSKSSLHVLKTHFFANKLASCQQNQAEAPRLRWVCQHFNLGDCVAISEINLGLTNAIYRIKTTTGNFVVKLIDSMSDRARTLEDYQAIEATNAHYKSQGLSTIAALKDDHDRYALFIDNKIALVYPYHAARPLSGPIGPINPSQAKAVGALLAEIHQLAPSSVSIHPIVNDINKDSWQNLYAQGREANARWALSLQNNIEQHCQWLQDYEQAHKKLMCNLIFSHGDFCPHNLLEDKDTLHVIDWELAGLINPQTELMLCLIMCSGFATDREYHEEIIVDLLASYLQAGGYPLQDIEAAFWGAIGKGWFDWIRFNLTRSLSAELNSKEHLAFSDNALCALESLMIVMAKKEQLMSLCQQTLATIETPACRQLP